VLNRILAIAVIAGLVAGLLASAMQVLWTTPLIVEAERYEQGTAIPSAVEPHTAHGHDHDEDGWAPADGLQRTAFTILTHVLIATGFGLLLAGAQALLGRGTLATGLLWGAAGFLAFHAAPALGLPPELPGTVAGPLAARQAWWLATVLCTGGGLALLAFGRKPALRLAGPIVIVLPHLCGAPQPEVHAALAPETLQTEFVVASLVTNGLMWLVLGGVSGFLFDRLIGPAGRRPVDASPTATMPRSGAGRRR
jgi:cobalt transporter subunit CbtA